MPYREVWVDDNLSDYDDGELIDELESRGWWVSPEKNWQPDETLEDYEKDMICSLILDSLPRANFDSVAMNEIYEKLRKR